MMNGFKGKIQLIVLMTTIVLAIGFLVACDSDSDDTISSIDDLDGKTIGVDIEAIYSNQLSEKFPNSKINFYADMTDLNRALMSNKIDAFAYDYYISKDVEEYNPEAKMISDSIFTYDTAFILKKGNDELLEKINAKILEYKSNGKIEELQHEWFDQDECSVDITADKNAPNGELRIGVVSDKYPMTYVKDEENVGYDVDLICLIAQDLGYYPVRTNYSFDGLVNSVLSGREDVIVGNLLLSDERKDNVAFTETVYTGNIAIVVNEANYVDDSSIWQKLKRGLVNTFVKENRWQMIGRGILVTILISIIVLILGTILGGAFCEALRSKRKIISIPMSILSQILDAMPVLILLMILFYLIFAKVALPAIIVAIIGLTMDFSNTVAVLLNTGIETVDKGQIEAAKALGYSNWHAFRKITLPQAAHTMFQQYSAAIISLIKGTSIVGFITVQDLTRVTDIIRSHTYDAFFPLIVAAVVYFVIAYIFIKVLDKLTIKLNPKQRKRRVKGVKIHD